MSKDTILILDKEFNTQWTLKTLLEAEKYIVIAVNSIDRAMQNFSEFEVSGFVTEFRIDYILTIEAIRELKKRFPELYVMMLTNEDIGEEDYGRILDAGVDDFFLKTSSNEKILLHLKKGLQRRTIHLQKKKLEEELNQIKRKRNTQGKNQIEQNFSVNKSFT
jgi:DNA-binding response OmpR family regulator